MTTDQSISSKFLLSIIIINYNLEDEIEKCVCSLLGTLNRIKFLSDAFEIIIVDNNSPNKKLPELEKKFESDKIHFHYSDINLGFGKGCNLGASKAIGDYLLFLNPDTIVQEDIFTPIFNLFNSDNQIGIIAPKQQVRKPFFDFSAGFNPNIFYELLNLFGVGVFFEGFLMNTLTKFSSRNFIKVDWILGAAIFIKKNLFEEINGFDRDYFMFFEELDLCKRVAKKGYKIIYYYSIKINHIGSVSGKKNYFLYTVRTYASKKLFFEKHFNFPLKQILILLLYLQLFSQIFIWMLLSPISKEKSKQKIQSFVYLIKHNLINKIDIT